MCSHMLFLHALLGCDTTSHIYGIGKVTALKKAMTNEHFRKQAHVFELATPTVEELVTAGEQAIVCVHGHGGNIGENLDDLRYKGFIEKVASSAVYVQLLPTITASESTIRSNSGKDPRKLSKPRTGAGLSKTTAMFRR